MKIVLTERFAHRITVDMNHDGFYSTPEVAEALDASYADALSWAEEHELPRVGTSYVWNQSAIDDYAAELDAIDDDEEGEDEDGADSGDEDGDDEDGDDEDGGDEDGDDEDGDDEDE